MKIKRLYNLREMSNALCKKEVGKMEFIIYLVIFVFITASGILLLQPEAYISISVFYANLISMIIFTPLWLILAYVANKKGDGKDFWYRFISLTITLTIILGIGAVVLGFLIGIFMSPLILNSQEFSKIIWFDFYITNFFSLLYLYLTYKYIRLISSGCEKTNNETK